MDIVSLERRGARKYDDTKKCEIQGSVKIKGERKVEGKWTIHFYKLVYKQPCSFTPHHYIDPPSVSVYRKPLPTSIDQFLNSAFTMRISALLSFLFLLTRCNSATLKIISTSSGGPGPEPCALMCAGVERGDQDWRAMGRRAYHYIHYRQCEFVGVPSLTVTLQGHKCPPVYIHRETATSKVAQLYTFGDANPGLLMAYNCTMNWSASGYNCD